MNLERLGLRGRSPVPYKNMAAGISCNIYGLRKEHVRESMADFECLEHRMEHFLTSGGIKWVNDSRSTNVNSTWYALEQTVGPVVWIAGGVDGGNDYTIISELVKKKVRAIILLGLGKEKIHRAFSTMMLIVNVGNMENAVRAAKLLAVPGDTILLSPACASFDLFENHEDRGRQFKMCINI